MVDITVKLQYELGPATVDGVVVDDGHTVSSDTFNTETLLDYTSGSATSYWLPEKALAYLTRIDHDGVTGSPGNADVGSVNFTRALFRAHRLEALDFSGTAGITGTPPQCLGNPRLKNYQFNDTGVSGACPSLSHLTYLHRYYVNNTSVTSVPDFTDNTDLVDLRVEGNAALSGALPKAPIGTASDQAATVNTTENILRIYRCEACSFTSGINDSCKPSNHTDLEQYRVDANSLNETLDSDWISSDNVRLDYVFIFNNSLSGSMVDISVAPVLTDFRSHINSFTGSIPNLPDTLQVATFGNNGYTGDIPDISNATSLAYFAVNANSLTGWAGSTIPTTCKSFFAQNNNLPESVVDAILVQLDNNGQSNGTVNVGGTGNAAPSAAGSTAAANLTGKGWSVTTN